MQPTLLTRLRWRLEELRDSQDARVVVGILVLAVLVLGGFLAARTVARASTATPSSATTRMITLRQRVHVIRHGHVVTRWRSRTVSAQVLTVMQTRTLDSANGPVTLPGKTRTVLQQVRPTGAATRLVTVTREVTDSRVVTVEQPVTVVDTTTVVSTETESLPFTTTVTVPLP